jgi:myo-inositol 2-dehydrogenase / D-chiro-inositol 1-dehydrogenase
MSQPSAVNRSATQMTRPTSRRRFLQDSAALAAGTALGTLALAPPVHAAGDGTIKIGMIGAGGRCAGAARESMLASPDVKLVAMYDVFPHRVRRSREALQAELPQQVAVDDDHCFSDFDGYQKVIEASDAVMIACASKFHPMYSEAAIRAGRHVFVEKPNGIDPVGVRRMADACELAKKKGLSVLSGLQSRFDNGWQETVKRIHDGAIGDVVAMQSMFLRGPYGLVPRNPELSETQYQFSNWYHFRWLSGDDVPQSLVHNVDRMCWILHEQPPKWAFGLAGRSSSFGEVYGDMFDHHTVVYEYEQGTRLYALCRTQVGCYDNAGDIIMGTKGQCELASCRITGETNWTFDGTRQNPYLAEQAALVEAIKNDRPINSGYHMNLATMIGVMGQVTCYTGKPVTYDEVYNMDLQFGPAPDDVSFDTPPPSVPDESGNYPLPMPGITSVTDLA